ncbi:MAG: hypothetical protein J0L94_09645 [Rhodothermia bacterium]|nr:hypothetical protein [Rhodothermia bacterium]
MRTHKNPKTENVKNSVSNRQLWIFRMVMVLIPIAFFGFVELGLRIGGYGKTEALFVPLTENPEYLYPNQDVAKRYFGPNSVIPNPNADFFRKRKQPNTLRIVVQGESSAAGYPYYHGGSFSNMLKQRLKATFPGRPIEVINTGMAAISSYTLLDFAAEIEAIQPDMVLIYSGHNEYYGALGVGSSESLGSFQFLVRWYLKFKDLRIVQLLRNTFAAIAGWFAPDDKAPSATLMERMVREQRIPYGSAMYKMGEVQFEENMSALLAHYQKAGIPVFMGTLASNERDHAPFISGLQEQTNTSKWRKSIAQLKQALQNKQANALTLADQLVRMDTTSAEAYFLRGRALEQQANSNPSQYAAARKAYLKAKDLDMLRFRAPESLNQIIRRIAQKYGAVVVPSQEALAASSPNGIIGGTLMLEHLHPNLDGYFLISEAFYRAIIRHFPFSSRPNPIPMEAARGMVLMTGVDSTMADFRVRQLMASWPFKPFGTIDESLSKYQPKNEKEKIALKMLQRNTSWFAGQIEWADFLVKQAKMPQALQVGFTLLDAYEPTPDAWAYMAELYMTVGDMQQAQTCVEEAVAATRNATQKADLYNKLGLAMMSRKYLGDALAAFNRSNNLQENFTALKWIGSLLLQKAQEKKDITELNIAITHLEKANERKGDDKQILFNLAGAYAITGERQKATNLLQTLLAAYPNDADALALLQQLDG